MKRTRRRVKKEDFARILLTETATYDVPITFSNLGFYWHWKKYTEGKSLFPTLMQRLFEADSANYTIPLNFKMRKDADSFRTLALIHPVSQIRFIEFYKEFDQQILLACQKSAFSIRCPDKVGSKYYIRNLHENRDKYKTRSVSRVDSESRSKHLTTYFSYRSHTRLHTFFDSVDFRSLEKKYTEFWSIDVARCFDSVYTHSITWALKNKRFSKVNRSVSNSFGSIFDRLMQGTNYNETAGIVIGSEVSRIFAEIIFQEIDKNILMRLSSLGVSEGVDYTIRRYVDDILIFATTSDIAKSVFDVVVDSLREYKFNVNVNKTSKISRPFITEQSRSIRLVKNCYKTLVERLLADEGEVPNKRKVPVYIFNRNKLLGAFLQEVKLACYDSLISYSLVAGYLISVFSNLLIIFADNSISVEFKDDKEKSRYANFFFVIIEAIFHLYTINPSSNGSMKIGLVVSCSCDFFDKKIPDEANAVRSLIYTLANDFFESSGFYGAAKDNNNIATLEALNILAAIKILGANFLISRQIIEKIVDMKTERNMSYFEITTLLYYIGHDKEKSFGKIKAAVLKSIKNILSDISDIKESAEKIHLLLDVLACPFVDAATRKTYTVALWSQMHLATLTDAEAEQLQRDFATYPWFTSWTSAEVLSSLEKKALLRSY